MHQTLPSVLVTGASGFVGRAVIDRLGATGASRIRGAVRRQEAELTKGVERVVVGDLSDATHWQDALRDIEVVVHLAGRAHVLHESVADPDAEFRRINVDATMRLARQALAGGVRRFVFVSSIGVNGTATNGRPFTEMDRPAPVEAYARSKLAAEEALTALAQSSAMELVIVRPPLVYGPDAPGNFGLLTKLVRCGVPLPFGRTRNRRSLIALDNLADFLVRCTTHPLAAGETFLVSDGEDLSTGELLGRYGHAMGGKVRLLPVPDRVLMTAAAIAGRGAMAQRLVGSLQVDIRKARERLAWQPLISVDEGLRRAAAGRGRVPTSLPAERRRDDLAVDGHGNGRRGGPT